MKLDPNLYQGKQPSLEEGPLRYERNHEDSIINRAERTNKCSSYCMQFMKVILYLELILFIGWIGSIFITNYYWDPRYNNVDGNYDLPDWAHDEYVRDSLINSDPLHVDNAGRSIQDDETKNNNEQSETFAELTNEDKNYSIETEAPTTPSVSEIHDMNKKESIYLSKWLSSFPELNDDWAHDEYIRDSLINSDPLHVDNAGRSIQDNDTKNDNEQGETFAELTNEDKNYSIETEAPTTPSVSEIHDMDKEESIFLSKWLSSLNLPDINDDWEESQRKSDNFWDRILTSFEDQNDDFVASPGEEMILSKDSDTGSMMKNYISTMDAIKNELRKIDADDFSPLTFWQDFSSASDDMNEMADSEKDILQDDRFKTMRFDFELPDLMLNHLLRQSRSTDTVNNSDSSSSSEETENPNPIIKCSSESSSSEETKNSAPKTKRSTESSSSEETKNPAPKTKRSAESSSSESDKSDSSDSSSSENDRTTTEGSEVVKNCPQFVSENGKTIDDPREIINHIKKNWFNWLLETPVPDCVEPKSTKTITIDECGKFVIKCTQADSDSETTDKMKEDSTSHRNTRSIEENDVEREKCKRELSSMFENFDNLRIQVVIGEASDPIVKKLRQDFGNAVSMLTFQVIAETLIGRSNWTDEKWQDSVEDIRQNITNLMDAERRRQLEESGLSDQAVTNGIRDTVESYSSIYMNCHKALATSSESRFAIMFMNIIVERLKCSITWNATEETTRSLATKIVTGENSYWDVVELRQRFKTMIEGLAAILAVQEMPDPAVLPTGPVNITDDQLRVYIIEIQMELAKSTNDPTIQERIAHGPPTQQQMNELRTILEYYLRQHRRCETFFGPSYHELSTSDVMRVWRKKRSVLVDPESKQTTVQCGRDENDVQLEANRQVKLAAWAKEKATGTRNHEFVEHSLAAIEPQLSAANTSEIPVTAVSPVHRGLLEAVNHLLLNSSSELRREGYELLRDFILEIQDMKDNVGGWEGYNTTQLAENLTECLYGTREDLNSEMIFGIIVNAGRAGNLRYSGLGHIEDCSKPYTPVYGTFTYVGEEPESSGIQQWRHLLNGIIKLYFKIEDRKAHPEFTCNSNEAETKITEKSENAESKNVVKRSVGSPKQESETTVQCGRDENDIQLQADRQVRLAAWAKEKAAGTRNHEFVENSLAAIEPQLSAANTSEIPVFAVSGIYRGLVILMNHLLLNSSSELRREGYELLRDLILEIQDMKDNVGSWEGYNITKLTENFTECLYGSEEDVTSEMIFGIVVNAGRTGNLRYSGLGHIEDCNKPYIPVYGTFSYVGEEPESSGIQRWRHLLNGIIKLYFKIEDRKAHPEFRCNSNEAETKITEKSENEESKNVVKRSIGSPKQESETTVQCGRDENDIQLQADRQVRLAAWAKEKATGTRNHEFVENSLAAIEPQLSAANTSEIPVAAVPGIYRGLVILMNHLLLNSSSELRREGYELLRDLILEIQDMKDNVGGWEGYNITKLTENFTECLYGSEEDVTSEMIFGIVVNAGRTGNLRYSGLGHIEDCNKPYIPVYGTFSYVGEEPESSGIQRWRHLLNGIIKLYFKIEDRKAHPEFRCNSNEAETKITEKSENEESKNVVKRSIGYPNRKSDNSVNMADKAYLESQDSGSLRRANLYIDAEQQTFDMSQEMFFDRMELLSSHIDRLHERYVKFNELNDDYVSREFPIESPLNNEY